MQSPTASRFVARLPAVVLPTGQAMHWLLALMASVTEYLPEAQRMQSLGESWSAAVAPVLPYFPSGHTMHWFGELIPVVAEYSPDEQGMPGNADIVLGQASHIKGVLAYMSSHAQSSSAS